MTDYKLMPKSIVDELAQFIRQADGNNKIGAGSLAEKICERFHVADPAVQGEPVSLAASAQKPVGYVSQDFLDGKWSLDHIAKSDEGQISRTIPLYTAPQPAVQKPDVTLLLGLLEHARCNTCDGSGGLYDNHGNPHQCQWCHDRSEALAAYRKQGGK